MFKFAIAALFAAGASAAAGATLTADYQLNGSGADALGGAALSFGGGAQGATGYSFVKNGGANSVVVPAADYSIEFSISFTPLSGGYVKLIDFKGLTSDRGLYVLGTALNFYPVVSGPSADFASNVFSHVVLTRDAATRAVRGYVDGDLALSFTDTSDLAVFSGAGFLFQDDNATSRSEAAPGTVDFLRIYSGALTETEVGTLASGGALATASVAPVPVPAALPLLAVAIAGLGALSRRRRV